MSERGVFAVDRGIWDHDYLVGSEPFSRREAWLWIVSEAAWRPHRRRIAGRQISVARGQVAASLRFMAAKWRWSEPRVRRFLAGLISEVMIDARTDAGVTLVTICNYDAYQRVSLPGGAPPEGEVDAGATQERRKVEDMEYKEQDSVANATGAAAPAGSSALPTEPVYTDSTHQLWVEGVETMIQLGVKEPSARRMIGRWLKSSSNDPVTVLGAIQRARHARTGDPIAFVTGALPTNNRGPPRKASGKGYLELALQLEQQDHERNHEDPESQSISGSEH